MKKSFLFVAITTSMMISVGHALAAPVSSGNLVMYRVGNGSDALSNRGNAVFVDEYTPAGVLVQSIALPNTGTSGRLIASNDVSEGLLTVSPNGRWITVTGYDTTLGGTAVLASTASTAVKRSVAVIDATTGLVSSVTSLTDWASGYNPRSAITDDGNRLWMAGRNPSVSSRAVRYATVGSTTSIQMSSTSYDNGEIQIFDGNLYVVSKVLGGSSGLTRIGTGLPTTTTGSASTFTGLPTTTAQYSFFLADLDATAGVDTLYLASDDGGALSKYSKGPTQWFFSGTVGTDADDYRGLTATITPDGVQLFATRKATITGGGELVSLLDASGFNGTLAGTPTFITSASALTAFRGVGIVIPAPATSVMLGITGLATISRRRR